MTNPTPATIIDSLRELQTRIGAGNASRGFHEEGDQLRALASSPAGEVSGADAALRNYYTARLALLTTEVAEAIEELRNGRAVDEAYYSGRFVVVDESEPYPERKPTDSAGNPRKPEGVPSEVADVVIRAFDFAEEAGIDLASVIIEKLAYNDTRARLHGRTF